MGLYLVVMIIKNDLVQQQQHMVTKVDWKKRRKKKRV